MISGPNIQILQVKKVWNEALDKASLPTGSFVGFSRQVRSLEKKKSTWPRGMKAKDPVQFSQP